MTVCTLKGLCRRLDIPEDEMRQLVKGGTVSRGKIGEDRFDLEETAAELIRHYRALRDDEQTADLQQERALLARVRRKNAEFDLALRTKELHRTEDIEFLLTQMLISFKAKLSALPSKLAPQLSRVDDSAQVYDILKRAIDETQTELADYDAVFSSDGEG